MKTGTEKRTAIVAVVIAILIPERQEDIRLHHQESR